MSVALAGGRECQDLAILGTGRAFLESGVTTIRDAGWTPAGIRRVFARGEFAGPRVQVSIMPLSITGGHGDGMTPSGIDLNAGPPESELPPGVADGPDEVRRVVRRQIGAGADWIKVMATGGVFSLLDASDAVQYTVDEIRVMVEEADAAGIHGVMAHAENARGIKAALRAGVRSIEHGNGIDGEAIDLMHERDVPLVPTFLVSEEMLREDLGSLEPGRIADLVLVDFDPLTEPACWRDPARLVAVVQGSRVISARDGTRTRRSI